MTGYIKVSKDYLCLVSDENKFYIGAKHFPTIIKAIETAMSMPTGSIITLKVDVEKEEYTEEEEKSEEEIF